MADIYEKLLGLDTPEAAPQATTEDPYEAAVRRQAALPSQYSQAEPTLRLAAPYRQAAFPDYPPAPWSLPEPQAVPGQPRQVVGTGLAAGAGGATTPTPSPDDPMSPLGRGLYGFARGLYSTPGILGDVYNFLSQGNPTGSLVELPGQQDLKKGIDVVADATGLRNGPATPGTWGETAERWGGTAGEIFGPAGLIKKLSAGAIKSVPMARDMVMALQAVVGEEIARALASGSTPEELERAGKIGAGTVPLLYQVAKGLLSRGLQRSGLTHLPKQVDLPAAEKKLGEATTGLETTTEEYAARLKALQDKNRMAQTAEEQRLIPLTAAEEAEKARVAAVTEQTGQATAQAKERAAFATQTAEEQAGIAKSEVQTPAQLEAEALKPLTPQVEALQPTPGVREPGAEIQQAVVRQAEADTAARQAGHTALADKWKNEIGPQLDDVALIDMTQKDVRPAFLKQRAVAGKAFNDVEEALKGQQVVEAPGMRKALGRLVSEAEASNGSVSQQYLDLAELGLSPAQKATIEGSGMERAKQALKLVPEEKLEFSAFRDVEEKLYAAGGGKPLGTLQQAPPRYLKQAVQEDMHRFFNSDEGTGAGPAMQLAKAGWNKFLTEYDRGIITQLTDQRAGHHAQKFLGFLKNTSRQQIPELEAVLRNVKPDTRAAISAHVAADMVEKATDTVTKVISPIVMKRQVQRLQKNGTFGILFDETQQKQILDAVHEMTGKDTSLLPKFRKALEGRDPEDVARFIFEPGKVTRTEQYQMIQPDKFPLARQAWARQFLQDYETGGAPVVQKQLTQLLREDNGVSQLSMMFPEHEFPGVVDKFKSVHAELRSAPERAAATSERSTRMAEGAKETKSLGEKSVQLTEEAGERMLATAQARADAVTQKVKDGEARLHEMKTTGAKREGYQKESEALALKRAKDEQRVAQQAVDELKMKVKNIKEGWPMRVASHLVGTGGGTFAFLYGMTHSTPLAPYMLVTGGAAMALDATRYAMPALARSSPLVQRLMREGLSTQYGPQAAQWVRQTFLNTPEQPEGEPTNAPPP